MWVERLLNSESIDWAIGMSDLSLKVTYGMLIWGRSSSLSMIICIYSMSAVTVHIYVNSWLYMLIVDLDVDMLL